MDENVTTKLERLQAAVSAGGKYFNPFVAERAQKDLRATQERMELGAGATVVALVGGTGSGKSSMFNAITGLDFADDGQIRPTTERATACTFNVEAGPLLDYLGVDPERRIEHGSILTRDQHSMDGLVLLDLPDYDSVELAHSAQVERLLPMADLLIWVLDPQKYADQLLHQGFLSTLRSRREAIIVALNQIDTVAPADRDVLVADLRRLLEADGLGDVDIFLTSALYGDGIDDVRARLALVASGPSVTERTAAAELAAIGGRLRGDVGEDEADLGFIDEVDEQILSASGVAAVEEAIAEANSLQVTALSSPEQPANTMVVAIRDSWVSHVRQGLPPLWQEAVADAVAPPERLRRALGNALQAVPLRAASRKPLVFALVGALLLVVAGVVGAVLLGPVWAKAAAGAGGLLGALVVWMIGKRVLRARSMQASSQFVEAARWAVSEVTRGLMVDGPAEILAAHKATREALADL